MDAIKKIKIVFTDICFVVSLFIRYKFCGFLSKAVAYVVIGYCNVVLFFVMIYDFLIGNNNNIEKYGHHEKD